MLSLKRMCVLKFSAMYYRVANVGLDLQPGEVKTLFGPSGCGKTTVLRF